MWKGHLQSRQAWATQATYEDSKVFSIQTTNLSLGFSFIRDQGAVLTGQSEGVTFSITCSGDLLTVEALLSALPAQVTFQSLVNSSYFHHTCSIEERSISGSQERAKASKVIPSLSADV